MNVMQMYQQFRQNPMVMLNQRYNIPQNLTNPNEIIQHLLNTGQVSQSQVNQVMSMRDNPMFKGMF
jgi:rRNA pseudouridine-1189 N-methylase Emg1 (Nep1/Mra1 family)